MPSKPNIMVVEDEGIVAAQIQEALLNFGYDVADVSLSGEEALKKIEKAKPNLVVLDIRLKKMTGIEVAKQIRKSLDIPIVYLTAYSDEDTLQQAKETEPFGYILKPFDERSLHAAIQMALNKYESQRKLQEKNDQLHSLITSLAEAVIISDLDGVVRFMNPAAEAITRWDQEEAFGKKLNDVFQILEATNRAEVRLPFSEIVRGGTVFRDRLILVAKDNTERGVDSSISSLRNKQGMTDGIILVFRGTNEHETSSKMAGCAAAGGKSIPLKPSPPRESVCIDGYPESYSELPENAPGSMGKHHSNKKNQVGRYPEVQNRAHFAELITADEKMHSIFMFVEAVAPTDQTVLIVGETGTGKELLAEAIHRASGRKELFVTVDIAGLDDTMFTDTLFGHTAGAYTGAAGERQGLVLKASSGTLFLDEIGDLDMKSQIKLLRLIDKREYYKLGSDQVQKARARFVLATNRDLGKLMKEGLFRKDLYYRLSTHQIEVPPLRERSDDIPLLVRYFVKRAVTELGKELPPISSQALWCLQQYCFPGNVRELQSMVFSALTQTCKDRQFEELLLFRLDTSTKPDGKQPELPHSDRSIQFPEKLPTVKEISDLLVNEALQRTGWNQSAAAALVGLTPSAINKRIKSKLS